MGYYGKKTTTKFMYTDIHRADVLEVTLEILKNCLKDIPKEEYELIISDNNSTDKTYDVLLNFKEKNKDMNIKIYGQERNLGYDGNVLFVYGKACGEYCWFLSDKYDYSQVNIKTIIEVIKKHNPNLITFLKGDGNIINKRKRLFSDNIFLEKSDINRIIKYSIIINEKFFVIEKNNLDELGYVPRMTIISSCIIKNNKINYDLREYVGTNFIQIPIFANSYTGMIAILKYSSFKRFHQLAKKKCPNRWNEITSFKGLLYVEKYFNLLGDYQVIFNSGMKDLLIKNKITKFKQINDLSAEFRCRVSIEIYILFLLIKLRLINVFKTIKQLTSKGI
jgi:hypothetical protein